MDTQAFDSLLPPTSRPRTQDNVDPADTNLARCNTGDRWRLCATLSMKVGSLDVNWALTGRESLAAYIIGRCFDSSQYIALPRFAYLDET